jgi:hypothetical protein
MSRPLGYGGKGTILRANNPAGAARTAPKYPHPFFDQGQAYLPTSVKNMFHWCRFYFLTNPAVHAAITKMAEYPVTPIIFKTENNTLRKKYEEIARQLDLKSFRVEVGLDYYTYGNAFVSLVFPFTKFLQCKHCKTQVSIKDPKTKYKWVSSKYQLDCKKCGTNGFAKSIDVYRKSLRGIRLKRWNPEAIDVRVNSLTSETTYIYDIPKQTINDILMGKKHAIEDLPDVFILAAQKKKRVVFSPENLYHFKRPMLAQQSEGYGMPLVMPVLKDLHYLGILRRSQEAVAQEHIVPLRIVFPQGGTATSDPYSMVNLGEWKNEVQRQLSQWKIDPNRIPVMPLPIGYQTIGGNGRALVLHNEYRVWSEHVVAGMGVPPEFVFGGIQYSGTNLTMFQLQNKFLSYIDDQRDLIFNFIFGKIAAYMDFPDVDGDFRPFKMADDLQRTMLYFQLVQGQKLADRTLLEDLGFDPTLERAKMDAERGEMLELQKRMQQQQAHMQGDIMQINTRYQMENQKTQTIAQLELQKVQQEMQEQMQKEMQAKQQAEMASQAATGGQAPGMLPNGAMTGDAVMPGFPEGATAYSANAGRVPQTGVAPWVAAQGGSRDGQQMDMSYVAKRAASYISKLGPDMQGPALQRMQSANPQLFQMVQQILLSRQGSQTNPLNPMQSALPTQKPQRREPLRRIGG